MPPAARLGDHHTCPHSSGGTIAVGSPNVIIGNGRGGGPAGAKGTARSNAAPFVRP